MNLINLKRQKTGKNIKNKETSFNNLNPRVITDNKKFWSAVKPLFSDKSKAMNTIILYEKGKIIKNYKKVSEVLNKYFTNLTKSIKLQKCIWRKSFLNISTETFTFPKIRDTETLEIIKVLPKNKATVFKDISMRIIKDAARVNSRILTIIFNNCLKNSKFPDILKYADITPVF